MLNTDVPPEVNTDAAGLGGGGEAAAREVPISYSAVRDESGSRENRSRWNSLRHGCMAKVLLPADLQEEVDRHIEMLTKRHRPADDYETSLIATLGRASAQLERIRKLIIVDLQRIMDRAVLCWDQDRGVYIDKLIRTLSTDPAGARAMARSKQGALWMVAAWRELADVVEFSGRWTPDQMRLALDLKGVQPETREGYIARWTAEADPQKLLAIATDEIEWLEGLLDRYLMACDQAHQDGVAAGLPGEEDAQTKRLRKQESRLKLERRQAEKELMEYRAEKAAAAAATAAEATSAPETGTDTETEAESELSPVKSSTRPAATVKLDPPARPPTSNAAHKFQVRRQSMGMDGFEVPATATEPAKTMYPWLPFPGGDPEPESDREFESDADSDTVADSEPESELAPASAPVAHAEPAAPRPRSEAVASDAAREAVAIDRRQKERVRRRAQEKKARKAARRRR